MAKWDDWREAARREAVAFLAREGAAAALSVRGCAALAALCYKADADALEEAMDAAGWDYLGVSGDAKFGYDAAALIHKNSRTLALLNRGTELSKSLPDFMQNVLAVALQEDFGQIKEAVEFAVSAWTQCGLRGGARVAAIGHSLGGGLAEAQVAFLGAALGAQAKPDLIYGIGIGTAGYKATIKRVGAENGWAMDEALANHTITNFVRREDVVQKLPLRARLGSEKRVASLYQAEQAQAANGRGFEWTIGADEIQNHDPALYFTYLDTPPEQHLFGRWARSGVIEVRDGDRPVNYRRSALPKGDA